MCKTLTTMADRFKEARERYLGLKQKELAEQLGVSPSHISGIESGKKVPSDRLIELFCLKFNISKDWLLHGSNDIQVTNTGSSTGSKYGEFIVNKDDDYETATGYVVRYMKLLKYFCVAGDFNGRFDEIINDSTLEIILNYIVEKYLYYKDNDDNFEEKFGDRFSEAMDDFDDYSRTYICRKTDELAYRLEHRPNIWKLAEDVENILEPKGSKLNSYKIGDLMVAEEKLLMCNISGIAEMYSDNPNVTKSDSSSHSQD